MVNIHEALQKAKQEQQERRRQLASQPLVDRTVESAEDIEPTSSAVEKESVIHLAPAEIKSYVDPHVVSYFDPGSLAAEQFRSIRTAISAMREQPLRSLVLTSSTRGEGKTTVTANLGVVLAGDLDQRILLIDGDMRKPKLANLFGIPQEPGLTDILLGRIGTSFSEIDNKVIRSTELERLDVLPCGAKTDNPTELLGSKHMQLLIDKLLEKYTRILIDTPPIIAVTDASVVGSLADGTILVVQAGKTRREVITRALSLLSTARNSVVGCILNGIEYHIPNYIYRYI